MRIFGVILAGGTGRRMGGTDKALLRLGGRTLLSRAIERLEPQVEQLALSANGEAARFGGALPVLPDAGGAGPLAGVLAALDWAAPLGATAVVSVAVDTPFFPGDLVPQLLLAAETEHTRFWFIVLLVLLPLAMSMASRIGSTSRRRVGARQTRRFSGSAVRALPGDGCRADCR